MKIFRLLPFIFAALFAITACKKSTPQGSENPSPVGSTGNTGNTVVVVKTKPDPGVYIVGNKSLGDRNIDLRATIWKNNNPIPLLAIGSSATAICIHDTSIYVAGMEYPNISTSNAVYWVNEKMIRLAFSGNASTLGIGVVGEDVYVAGNISNPTLQGVYWKNGNIVLLPGTAAKVTGMAVKGNDVYLCGSYGAATPAAHLAACYWKNGVLYGTTDNENESRATAIAVNDNGDVYLSGYTNGTITPRAGGYNRPAFWKNNVITVLPNDKRAAIANGIAVDGGNIYVSGTADDGVNASGSINPKGVLWTNGTPKNLENSLSGGWVTAIQGEVYVSGLRPIDPLTAYSIMLKDGVIIAQSPSTSFNGVSVVK